MQTSAIGLKATPCFKGERGYSAYEIAVQNGFIGTEQDWLAMLGTASKYERITEVYTTTEENETTFDIPGNYTSNSFVEIYVEGSKIDADSFTIDTEQNKIILTNALNVIGTKVEVILSTFSTNDFSETRLKEFISKALDTVKMLAPDQCRRLPAKERKTTEAVTGQELHLFDPETEKAILN